ncbi:MAG: hypothetical protein MUP41_07915 [Desulfobacterales bacterium]|nr:hypothetical protein [Desulfobacterales bacterium]
MTGYAKKVSMRAVNLIEQAQSREDWDMCKEAIVELLEQEIGRSFWNGARFIQKRWKGYRPDENVGAPVVPAEY